MLAAVLALASSVSWGIGDFIGGLQSRRHALLAVLVLSQLVALTLVVIAVLAARRPSTTRARRSGRPAARARPARARRVLPRALDRHDERRRADLGHRRGDPGAGRARVGRAAGRAAARGHRAGGRRGRARGARAAGRGRGARAAPAAPRSGWRSSRAIGFGSFFAGIDRAEETADVAWVLLVAAQRRRGAAARRLRGRAPARPAGAAGAGRDRRGRRLRPAREPAVRHRRRARAAQRGRRARVALPRGHGRARALRAARAAVADAGRRACWSRSPGSSRSRRASLGKRNFARPARFHPEMRRPCSPSPCCSPCSPLPGAASASQQPGHELRGARRAAQRLRARVDARRDPAHGREPDPPARVLGAVLGAAGRARRPPKVDTADPNAVPGRDLGPARPARRLDHAARDQAAAHAHRPGAEVGDGEEEGPPSTTRAPRCSGAGCAPSSRATATA